MTISYEKLMNNASSDAQKFTVNLKDRDVVGIFTNLRIDRATLPEGKFAYDLRHDDDDADICSLEPSVFVNHAGTFICNEEIEFGEQNCIYLGEGREAYYSF